MKCPHCSTDIGLFSKEMKALGKAKACPHCGKGVKLGLNYGRFTLIFFAIAIPNIFLGWSSPVTAGVAGGVAATFGMDLKKT